MCKEVDLKKFLLSLGVFLVLLSVVLYFVFTKTTPLCSVNGNYCKVATCNRCVENDGKRICSDCSVFNKEKERIWTGGCIYTK